MVLRLGVVSTARINDQILSAAAKSDLVEVVAVASRDDRRARAYAEQRGIARWHGSYQSLLDDDQVEAVYISLPNSMHAEWARRALYAGKHVLCEKPFSRNVVDTEATFDVAEASGLVLMEGLMYRHHPQTRRTAELVKAGAIGRPQFVRASLSFQLKEPDIRLSSDLAGGALMDLGCYCVSSIRLIGGEAATVFATKMTTIGGVDSQFFATLVFPEDIVGQFDVAMTMPYRGELEIVGTEGIIFVADPWICAKPGIDIRRGDKVEHIKIDTCDHYQLELENMCRAVRGEEPPLLGRADALGQARTIGFLYKSASLGAKELQV